MNAQATARKLTVEEYLSDPELEKLELVDGVAVETGMGSKKHSIIQLQCGYLLKTDLRSRSGYYAATELRCRLEVDGRVRFRLPDVCVVAGEGGEGEPRYLDGAPLLVAEILSPEKTVAELMRKVDEYFANGCKLAWLILPDEESVLVRAPGRDIRAVVKGDALDGGEALPGLKIEASELFE